MRYIDQPAYHSFCSGERALAQRAGAPIGGEEVRELDQHKTFAAPIRVMLIQCLRWLGVVPFDQQAGEYIGIDDASASNRQRPHQQRHTA